MIPSFLVHFITTYGGSGKVYTPLKITSVPLCHYVYQSHDVLGRERGGYCLFKSQAMIIFKASKII